MKDKKLAITIGIPAYNAQGNIRLLLQSLAKQTLHKNSIIEIIVYSDGSTDKTVQQAATVGDKRIILVEAHVRRGLVHGLKTMLARARGDIFILLNDDVIVGSQTLVEDLIKPFLAHTNVGLVSGNPQPLTPTTFVQKAGVSTFRVYERMRYRISGGNNKHTCDGKILALSRAFIQNLIFPLRDSDMANVDAYLYLACQAQKRTYRHVRRAKVFFPFPKTITDYVAWNSRNNADPYILKKTFGAKSTQAWAKPARVYIPSLMVEVVSRPLECLLAAGLGVVCQLKARAQYRKATPVWESVQSTKL